MRATRKALYVVEDGEHEPAVKRIFFELDYSEAARKAERYVDTFERVTDRRLRVIEVELAPDIGREYCRRQ